MLRPRCWAVLRRGGGRLRCHRQGQVEALAAKFEEDECYLGKAKGGRSGRAGGRGSRGKGPAFGAGRGSRKGVPTSPPKSGGKGNQVDVTKQVCILGFFGICRDPGSCQRRHDVKKLPQP